LRFLESPFHQQHPAITGALVDGKRHVAHPQAWMAALLDIAWRSAEAADEKVAQTLFRSREIVRRIHGAEHLIGRNLGVERTDQPGKAFFSNPCVDLFFGQIHNPSMTDETPKTAYEVAMERLRRKDAEDGVEERSVTEEQKAEIAEIRRVYAAKIAEAEILHKSKLMAVFDPEQRALAEQNHRRDLERLREDLERKLAKLRA
jgi:hypothetical protein